MTERNIAPALEKEIETETEIDTEIEPVKHCEGQRGWPRNFLFPKRPGPTRPPLEGLKPGAEPRLNLKTGWPGHKGIATPVSETGPGVPLRGRTILRPAGGNKPVAVAGQALIPVVLFMVLAIMLLGVILEAGNLFVARRQLQNAADAAATWGAMQLDLDGLRLSNGADVEVISPGDSQATADRAGLAIISFMNEAGYRPEEWTWQWGRCAMQINLNRRIPTVFGSIFGLKEVTVAVSAKARLNNTDQPVSCGE